MKGLQKKVNALLSDGNGPSGLLIQTVDTGLFSVPCTDSEHWIISI